MDQGGGEAKEKVISFIMTITILFMVDKIWLAIVVSGGILWIINSKERLILYKWKTKVLLCVIIVLCIKHGESPVALMVKGIAAICLVLVMTYSKNLQKLLEGKVLRRLSKYSYEIYLVHTPVNNLVIYFCFITLKELNILSNKSVVVLMYFFSLTVTVFFSVFLSKLCEKVMELVNKKIIYNSRSR